MSRELLRFRRQAVVALLLAGSGVALACGLTSCAAPEKEESAAVSTIPWNRPERWEGAGALGGFVPQSN